MKHVLRILVLSIIWIIVWNDIYIVCMGYGFTLMYIFWWIIQVALLVQMGITICKFHQNIYLFQMVSITIHNLLASKKQSYKPARLKMVGKWYSLIYIGPQGQGLYCQDLETGWPKLPILKFLGILFFKGDHNILR